MKLDQERIKEILLAHFSEVYSIKETLLSMQRGYEVNCGFRCSIETKIGRLELQIEFEKEFPYKIPHIYLIDGKKYGILPHLEEDGYICYQSSEGIFIYAEGGDHLIIQSIEKASSIIVTGYLGELEDELYNEFEAFWRRKINNKIKFHLFIPPGSLNSVTEKVAYNTKEDPNLWILDDDDKVASSKYNLGTIDKKAPTFLMELVTPIDIRKFLKEEKFSDLSFEELVLNNLTGKGRKRLRRIIKDCKAREHFYIFSQKQPNDYLSIIGIKGIYNLKGGSFEPIIITRCYTDFLLERTLGNNAYNLKEKKILIVGLGAIGSRIPELLISAGIRKLTFIDKDRLTPENVFRHRGGALFIGRNKATAMKKYIENLFPGVLVDKKEVDVFKLLSDFSFFKQFDLIILATGNPTLERLMHSIVRKLEIPMMSVWVEALGIGGHVLGIAKHSIKGCFDCLYHNRDGSPSGVNRSSFYEAGQIFTKSVSGCGSLFLPYGSVAAEKTAILTTETAIDILVGKENGNPFLSWKNESVDVGDLVTSARYNKAGSDYLNEKRYEYFVEKCPTCSLIAKSESFKI